MFHALVLFLISGPAVQLSWTPFPGNSASTITRVYRTNYHDGACNPVYHLKEGLLKDSWTDKTVLLHTSYCYEVTAYDKETGLESAPTEPVIVDVP